MSDALDSEYYRGFFNAINAIYDVLGDVEHRLMNNDGEVPELSRAVLALVRASINHLEDSVQQERQMALRYRDPAP